MVVSHQEWEDARHPCCVAMHIRGWLVPDNPNNGLNDAVTDDHTLDSCVNRDVVPWCCTHHRQQEDVLARRSVS